MTFFGETEHFSGKNGALRWSILVGKQKHNVQKPINFRSAMLVKEVFRSMRLASRHCCRVVFAKSAHERQLYLQAIN